nr:hypothetical protein Iba_chr05fCG16100 [Ipomoea batatas]GMD42276.1 hypothetical protein Iba_scaffold45526CG0010 [Ipomoea batatas]GME09650.1 hypothetical protein Iba_scaffold8947CG0200 [Ipomoea batatas]
MEVPSSSIASAATEVPLSCGKNKSGYAPPSDRLYCARALIYIIYSNYDTENIFDVMKIFLHLQSTRKKNISLSLSHGCPCLLQLII